ncbi:transmembrane amino acid transporter protein-domain-containing protein [Blastocladiella britannica]|nr:transmembrane amino acid transporter protein-domain-containing protein [Blastocladiella britannica]
MVDHGGPGPVVTGTASNSKVFFLLIKSFIGTGVLFLPSAFRDGGLAFSFTFLIFISYLSVRGMLLLAKVNRIVPGSFGDIAAALYGEPARYLVLSSISISQLGFCTAYMVFIAQNVMGFVKQIYGDDAASGVGVGTLIALQAALYTPLALVRKIKSFAVLSLIGDAFILGGLVVISAAAFGIIHERGGVAEDIVQFNKETFALYIGTAVYTFEGVGLVIPIAQSMAQPQDFGKVLSFTMTLTTLVYLFIASLGYLAWGNSVNTIVLLNLPVSPVSQTVYVLYMIAIVFTWPLVLFPAARILEQGVLPHASGKHSQLHKWQKNGLRSALVTGIALGAFVGADKLNKLVAVIGSFACIPLSFLYPSLLHIKAFPDQSKIGRAADLGMLAFGLVAMAYVTTMMFVL